MSGNRNDYLAGAIGGVSGLIVGHPLDTFKVILQTRNCTPDIRASSTQISAHGLASGYMARLQANWSLLKDLNNQGMVQGFFRGLALPVYSYAFVCSTYFGVYGMTLKFLESFSPLGEGRAVPGPLSGYWGMYVAGCCGGLAQCFLVCPAELVKVVLQSQATHNNAGSRDSAHGSAGKPRATGSTVQYFRGPMDAARWIMRHRGPLGFYRGFSPLLIRDVPTYGIYIVLYEALRKKLLRSRYADVDGIWPALLSGGVAGTVTWCLATPADVIKSRLQADVITSPPRYRSAVECCRAVYRAQGLRGFTLGLGVVCLRAFPVNAVTFLAYTKSLEYLQRTSDVI